MTMARAPRAIGIMAKAPVPGLVKTRLVPPLSIDQAAALYEAFVKDTSEMALRVVDARNFVIHPIGHESALRDLVHQSVTLLPQRGQDLGAAMLGATGELLEVAESVVIIGSDLPLLTSEVVTSAFDALETASCDVVFGPSSDGGYYLVGVRRGYPELFGRMTWSTETVLAESLKRAAASGLRAQLLVERYDIDTLDDLARLNAESAEPGTPARHTRDVLARLRAAGVTLRA
jgi:uncharacterized protein